MRLIVLVVLSLFCNETSLFSQSYISKAKKETGYIIKLIVNHHNFDEGSAHYFLKDINELKICDYGLTDTCLINNGLHEIITTYDDVSYYFCCMYNSILMKKILPDTVMNQLINGEIKINELVSDSILNQINKEEMKIIYDNDDFPYSLGNYYTTFSYKSKRVVYTFKICKANIFHCSCSNDENYNFAGMAIVKFENLEKISNEEIIKFDSFFKGTIKTKNYKPIKLPPISRGCE